MQIIVAEHRIRSFPVGLSQIELTGAKRPAPLAEVGSEFDDDQRRASLLRISTNAARPRPYGSRAFPTLLAFNEAVSP
jgi:hypothetical protein